MLISLSSSSKGHFEHSTDPSKEYSPSGQLIHLYVFVFKYVFLGHLVQDSEPFKEKENLGHSKHDSEPSLE